MNSIRILFLLLSTLLCIPSTGMTEVRGTVTDVRGNPILHALVTFTSVSDSSNVVMAVTDSMGHYDIADFPVMVAEDTPQQFALDQNYPNPFNPVTTIPFTLETPGQVTLSIYNITGQRITTLVDGYQGVGVHSVVWDGSDDAGRHVSAGVYLYRLTMDNRSLVKKMLLLDGGFSGGMVAPTYEPTAKRTAETSQTLYRVAVERFLYEKHIQENVDITETATLDVTLQNGELMVEIPGGTFQMGDQVGDLSDRCRPVHTVTVSTFEMSAYEITNAQYAQYLNEAKTANEITVTNETVTGSTGAWSGQMYINLRGYVSPPPVNDCIITYNDGTFSVTPGYETWPVAYVTWYGVKAFAEYYGIDLPREAEWEYACRWGNHQYMYGTDDGTISIDKANYSDFPPLLEHSVAVGSYSANPFGIHDMSGNVSEWCEDWYGEYTSEYVTDPTGAQVARSWRVIRGGNWSVPAPASRSASRSSAFPDVMCTNLGFRVVCRPAQQ